MADQPSSPSIDPACHAAREALEAAEAITVLVNDPQRHTDSAAVLARVLAGRDRRHVRALVATGSHRFGLAVRQDFERRMRAAAPVGEIAWHDARRGDLAPIGRGGLWRGHPWLLEPRAVLAVGSVEPHYFAGFTGAHKTCTIGCAAYEDIEANHARALDARCRPARRAGNPVHEGVAAMVAALEAARPVWAVNLVQRGAEVVAATFGKPLEALAAATVPAAQTFVRRIGAPADAVVAEVSGPLGGTFYQADKGIKNNEAAVRDGGVLVLVAPCPEGIGQDAFVALLRDAPTCAAAERLVRRRGYRLGDHKGVRLRRLTDRAARGVRVYAVSEGLSDTDAAVLGLRRAASAAGALAAAGIDPARARVLHVTDAGNTCLLPDELTPPDPTATVPA